MILFRRSALAFLLLATFAFGQSKAVPKPATAAPTPSSIFGFEPGADYHLADYAQMQPLLHFEQLLLAHSPRISLAWRDWTGRPAPRA